MKLEVGEFERVEESEPLELYHRGIKADKTGDKYTRMLRLVLCDLLEDILTGTFEQRAEQFVRQSREDPMWARDLMLSSKPNPINIRYRAHTTS